MADKDHSLPEDDWIALMVAWNKVATEQGVNQGDVHAMIDILRSHWNLFTDMNWVRRKAGE